MCTSVGVLANNINFFFLFLKSVTTAHGGDVMLLCESMRMWRVLLNMATHSRKSHCIILLSDCFVKPPLPGFSIPSTFATSIICDR